MLKYSVSRAALTEYPKGLSLSPFYVCIAAQWDRLYVYA